MNTSSLRRGLLLATAGFVVAFAASGQAIAGANAELKTAVAKPTSVEIDGRVWKCEAAKCEAIGDGAPQSLKRECKRVASELGALKMYSSENGKLDEAGVAACNVK